VALAEKSDSLDVELDSSSGQRPDDADANDMDARERPPESTNVTLAPEDRILGRCRLRYLVAQGGMASVYLAQFNAAQGFERWVAVKVVHPHLATDPRFMALALVRSALRCSQPPPSRSLRAAGQGLLDMARITARVQHPNVCSVVDFGKDDGTCYLVMEYLHGESVATVIRRARKGAGLPWQLACRIMAEACRGLHAAHELRDQEGKALGIVHRDISPQNLFVLYDGVTKVLDFGVAPYSPFEKTKEYAYTAPEQLMAQTLDRRTDIWALGVVLWEVLVGKRLFRGNSDGETVQRVMYGRIAKPTESGAPYRNANMPEIPRALDAIVAKATAREAHQRFATAAELADAIEDVLHEEGARAGGKEVQDWMREVFADRRAMREAMLRKEMPEGIVPSVELETARTLVTPKPDVNFTNALTAPRVAPPPPPKKAKQEIKHWQIALVGGAALGATLAFGMWLGRASETPEVPLQALPPLPSAQVLAQQAQVLAQQAQVPAQQAQVPAQQAQVPAQQAQVPVQQAQVPVQQAPLAEAQVPLPQGVLAEAQIPGAEAQMPPPEAQTPAQEAQTPASHGSRRGQPSGRGQAPATRAPVTSTRPTEARATGLVNIIAIPAVRIYLRGRSLGETPLANLSLPVGTHELEARPAEGDGPVRRQRVTVVEGETARVLFR
jgi:serine/threonine-protein kinase